MASVTIGNGVTSIGNSAFIDCSALTSVTIGNGIISIGAYAFRGCSIKECYCYATTSPSIDSYSFCNGVEEGATLYVPARCGAAYKASDWADYFDNIIEMD